jgi:putative ABC transport system permease protein
MRAMRNQRGRTRVTAINDLRTELRVRRCSEMSRLLEDIQYAARMFDRRPGFTAAFVLVLTLGIGANTAVFTVINSVLVRPLPYPDPDRLFALGETPRSFATYRIRRVFDRHYEAFRHRDVFLEHLTTFDEHDADLAGAGAPVHVPAAAVTPEFFETFGIQPVLGQTFLSVTGANGVVISSSLWRDQFSSDPHIIGRKVTTEGVDRVIIGVIPPGFAYPDGAVLWLPLKFDLDAPVRFSRATVGRLKHGATPDQVRTELQAVAGPKYNASVEPMKDAVVSSARRPLFILAGAVAFVLLIACANLAALSLTRADVRKEEIAVRAALGAAPYRIGRELLTESVLLSLAGGIGGLLFALWAVPVFLALAPEHELPRLAEIRLDWRVVAFTFGVSALTGTGFGFAPAVRMIRRPLRETLSRGGRTFTRASGLHGALVVVELALALVLLAGAGLMIKTVMRLRSLDLGFEPENVMTMRVLLPRSVYPSDETARSFESSLLKRLSAIPDVRGAGSVDDGPLGQFISQLPLVTAGGRDFRDYNVEKITVSPGYFQVMRIPLLRGREFTARDDSKADRVAIISESIAQELWHNEDPIGKRITLSDKEPPEGLRVVGVVKDIRQEADALRRRRAVYQSYLQGVMWEYPRELTFDVRSDADPDVLIPAMRTALHDVDPDRAPISIASMDDVMDERIATPRFETRILTAFSAMAVLLACIGVYGVMANSVQARTREIGIRIALGATAWAVLRRVFGRALMLTAVGVSAGIAAAVGITRVLTSLLFEVKPTDQATFAEVALLVTCVALLAGFIPAMQATRVDPVAVLRHD